MKANIEHLMAEAWSANRSGKLDRAEALLSAVLEDQPNHVGALLVMTVLAYRTERLEVAWSRVLDVLAIQPNSVVALNWAALICLDNQNLDQAYEFAKRAIAVAPENPESQNLLGRAALSLRRFEEALVAFRRAVELHPQEPSYKFGVGMALYELNRKLESAAVLRDAVRIAPQVEVLARLAKLELEIFEYANAVKYGRRALKLAADRSDIHRIVAQALMQLGRREEAEFHWDQAFSIDPNQAEAFNEKARCLLARGHFSEAIGTYRKTLELEPNNWLALYGIISSRKVEATDRDLLEQLAQLRQNPALSDQDRSQILFALGKAYDDLREYEVAIGYFDEANQLAYETSVETQAFNPDAMRVEVDQRIRLYNRELLSRPFPGQSLSDRPIFVLGMMRSGTTLVEQILSSHPEIGGVGERSFWVDFEAGMVNLKEGGIRLDRIPRGAEDFCNFLTRVAPGHRRVVEKNPANGMLAGLLHMAFPEARIIHVRREPVDNALSIWTTPMDTRAGFVANRSNIVSAIKEFHRLADHWRKVLPPNRFLAIRYEDLVAEPEAVSRTMVEFCGLDWNGACLHPERNEREVTTPSFWQVRQPIYKSSAERWRRYEPWLGEFRTLLP